MSRRRKSPSTTATTAARTATTTAVVIGLLGCAACTAGPLDIVGANGLARGLVAYWPLDELSGTTVADKSNHNYTGTTANGTTWIPDGKFAGALQFASGAEVTVPSFKDATPGWSVALWVRPAQDNLTPGYYTVISTEKVFAGGWEINIRADNLGLRYEFAYYAGPRMQDYLWVDCACVVADTWTHLAAVVDSQSGTMTLYQNGVQTLPATMPPADASRGSPIKPGNSTLYLGRWELATPARFFQGALDDIVIYERALTRGEIDLLQIDPLKR